MARATSLIIGGDGTIGKALAVRLAAAGIDVVGTTRRAGSVESGRAFLDLADDPRAWQPPYWPDMAYLCAAVTDVSACQERENETRRVNVTNTVALANRLVAEGAFVVFVSTNAVFDGTRPFRRADEAVCPTTAYGRQKAEAERLLLTLGRSVAGLRLTKVLHPEQSLFVGWKRGLSKRHPVRPYSDMVLAPVSIDLVGETLMRIGQAGEPGLYQLSGDGDIGYVDAARHMARRLGAGAELVEPTTSRNGGLKFHPFRYTSLDTSRVTSQFGIDPPNAFDVIDDVFGLPIP